MPFPRRLLTPGEEVVLDLRPHWVALVWPLAQTFVIVVAAAAALIYLPDPWPSWTRWAVVAVALVLFLWWPARKIVAWATSHFVVTTHRLIRREGWFAKRSKEIPLEQISDVTFTQSVFQRMVGAGDIRIESPGEFGQERFAYIRKPEEVQRTMYQMSERSQTRVRAPSASAAGPSLSLADELTKLDRLRDEGVLTEEEFAAQKARLLGRG